MVKKVIMNLDLSKASGLDCISVVVLKNSEPELSYILAELLDRQEKCDLFSDFQYGFRSSWSAADLPTVVSDKIARAFERFGATRAVVLDIFKAFGRVWHTGLLHKLKCYGISGQIFGLFSSFLSSRQLWVVLDRESSQEYPGVLEFVKAPFLALRFSCYTLMTFRTMLSMTLLSMLTILLSIASLIRHLICGNNLNWLLNLNLIYETLWTGVRRGLLISMLGKLS